MRSDTGRTDSLWMTTAPPRALPPLAEDLRTDVAVIGAGIAGITTAYLLALEGRRVLQGAGSDDAGLPLGEPRDRVHGPDSSRVGKGNGSAGVVVRTELAPARPLG